MKERASNIELLRIVALWMIVIYHIFAFCIYQYYSDANVVYKAIWLPLHIGVVLFILISGYFGIRPSVKGLVRLLSYMFVYSVPFSLYQNYVTGGGVFDAIKALLFVSNSPFWFMRTYLCLYALSPIINRLLENSNTKQWIQTILLLSFVAIYIGLAHFDDSLNSGKNVVCFSLIYIIGAAIRKFELWKLWKRRTYLYVYLGLNAFEMFIYILLSGNIVGEGFYYVCFHYCSPILILNAIMVLCYALNIEFRSKMVNWMASSSLAIYFLHTLFFGSLITPVVHYVYEYNSSLLFVIPSIFLIGVVIAVGCMLFDKLLYPVWRLFGLFVKPVENICDRILAVVNNLV